MTLAFLLGLVLSTTAHADLSAKFQEELSLDPDVNPVSTEVLAAVQERPVGIVSGFLSETIPEYFVDNIKSLHDDFFQFDVARFLPSSTPPFEENSVPVKKHLLRWWKRFGGHPLLILSHSEGANEILYTLLKNPDLIRNGVIDRVVLIQGAFGGSHFVDLLQNADSGDFPWAHPFRWLLHGWRGLRSLTTSAATASFSEAIAALDPADLQAIGERVYYVRAAQVAEKCALELQLPHLFIQGLFGASDGILTPEQQIIPGLGTDLGVLPADHFDLTERGPQVRTPGRVRRAFTRALMREFFEDRS